MNVKKLAINTALFIVVIILSVTLYRTIQVPVKFEKEYEIRKDKVVDRLKDIREAQKLYLRAKGSYAKSFDQLISAMQYDSVTTIKIVGDPNDSTIQTYFDTIQEPMMALFESVQSEFDVTELRYVPYSEQVEFSIDAGTVEKQRVTIPVFEVVAARDAFLGGMNPELVQNKTDLIVGSMTEGTDVGNWE